MNELLNGNFDGIKHGPSVFVLLHDTIVNKRSKKQMDIKHLTEEGWEGIHEPKWYDNISEGKGVLCWIRGGDVSIVKKINKDNLFENVFSDVLGDVHEVWPVKAEELAELLVDGLPQAKKTRKTAKDDKEESLEANIDEEVDEGNVQDSQSENSKSIVPPKEDVGTEKSEESEEIEEIEEIEENSEQESVKNDEALEISEDEIPF